MTVLSILQTSFIIVTAVLITALIAFLYFYWDKVLSYDESKLMIRLIVSIFASIIITLLLSLVN